MRTYRALRKLHPCLSETEGEHGRIHLPVCPSCNLACRYCRRSKDSVHDSPGASRGILPVEEVLRVLDQALALCPEITTVGIAGPGDTLATPHALDAFRIVDQNYPKLIKCMSTNGLLLAEKAEEIAQVHVDTVTVTVNAVEPKIQAQINERIFYHDVWLSGTEAAERLIWNQLSGIQKASGLGMIVKVNIVLIPGINDRHVETVAQAVADAGASICNIIPLIPQAGMVNMPAPDCKELGSARAAAGKYLDVFSHCQHCRADAVGKLNGEDFGRLVYGSLADRYEEHFSHG